MSDITLPNAGEHIRDFQSFLDSAVIGLDVFNDPVFASNLRPIALQLFYVLLLSRVFQSKWPHEVDQITNVKKWAISARIPDV